MDINNTSNNSRCKNTAKNLQEGHFPDAINIPLDQVAQRINEFKEMQKPIIAYCRSGNRSGVAVSILKQTWNY